MAQDSRYLGPRLRRLRRDLGLIGGARRLYGPLVNVLPFDLPPRFAGLDTTLKVLGQIRENLSRLDRASRAESSLRKS